MNPTLEIITRLMMMMNDDMTPEQKLITSREKAVSYEFDQIMKYNTAVETIKSGGTLELSKWSCEWFISGNITGRDISAEDGELLASKLYQLIDSHKADPWYNQNILKELKTGFKQSNSAGELRLVPFVSFSYILSQDNFNKFLQKSVKNRISHFYKAWVSDHLQKDSHYYTMFVEQLTNTSFYFLISDSIVEKFLNLDLEYNIDALGEDCYASHQECLKTLSEIDLRIQKDAT